MQALDFTLDNSENDHGNEAYLNNSTFVVRDSAFSLTLYPECDFWEFRIEFWDDSDHSLPSLQWKAGTLQRMGWRSPNILSLGQSGFKDFPPVLQESSHYKPSTSVRIYFQYLAERNSLFCTYTASGEDPFELTLPWHLPYSFFRLVAVAKEAHVRVSGRIEQFDIKEITQNRYPFAFKNLKFRLGDMLDKTVMAQTNLLLLPVSSNGTATDAIIQIAQDFGLKPPAPGNAGDIQIWPVPTLEEPYFVGYAYSVKSHTTSTNVIRALMQNLRKTLPANPDIIGVSLPLLGTGAGKLKPEDVAVLYDDFINEESWSVPVVVSIPSYKSFSVVKDRLRLSYYNMPYEILPEVPDLIKKVEVTLGIELHSSDYRLDTRGNLIYLNLSQQRPIDTITLMDFRHLRELVLDGFSGDLYFLNMLRGLESLSLKGCLEPRRDEYVSFLTNLTRLDMSSCEIINTDFLKSLVKLKYLRLRDNAISEIYALDSLKQLEYLDLSQNRLENISHLRRLRNLTNLNLAANQLTSIAALSRTTNLQILDISENGIEDIKVILKLPQLRYLKANKNPLAWVYDLILDDGENHLQIIQNYLQRQEEKGKVELHLPAKILLLGNHASGKSSLLHYIQEGTLADQQTSTHIIRIEPYPRHYNDIPEAIFFDFGGQDYYHGLYRAFLSGGAVHVLLWHPETNYNQRRRDSNQILTQDFALDYWLWQKKYLEKEKFHEDQSGPIVLVQTRADSSPKHYQLDLAEHQVEYDFFVSLIDVTRPTKQIEEVNNLALAYLKAVIFKLVDERKAKRREPLWFVNFIRFILRESQNADHRPKSVYQDILPHYKPEDNDQFDRLQIDLDQLHKQGLILYYKNDMPDKIWLNPVALVDYIHQYVLNPKLLRQDHQGILRTDQIPVDEDTLQLLIRQKVLFQHKGNEYIVPNFLPLASENQSDFDLLIFGLGKPIFTLKFKHFLPFGLINQIICFFGAESELKKYWRDQLLFTFNSSNKILINVNFELLEIKVYRSQGQDTHSSEDRGITQYLFYGIMSLYWDLPVLAYSDFLNFSQPDFELDNFSIEDTAYRKYEAAVNFYENDACRPVDLYISLDEKRFIRYTELCQESDQILIKTYSVNEGHTVVEDGPIVPIYPYQPFTRKTLKRPKKAVISYSRKDIHYVDKFRQYLVPLSDDGLMQNPWYCSELIAGEPWNEVVQAKFDEADIVFFMISENLMTSKYVQENEIKKAIDRWHQNPHSIMIVPIVLTPYHWKREGRYNLAQFKGLPEQTVPVSYFPDQNRAWNYITGALKVMLQHKLYPGTEHFDNDARLSQIYHDILNLGLGRSMI